MRKLHTFFMFIALFSTYGCCDDVIIVPDVETDDTGTDTGEPMPEPMPDSYCPGLSIDWPGDAQLACKAIACSVSGNRLTCSAAWALAESHEGDFALSAPGDLPWNEWPYNADAGLWEDADYIGGPLPTCGEVSLNIDAVQPNASGNREIWLTCSDYTAGLFTQHRVVLGEKGPIPD